MKKIKKLVAAAVCVAMVFGVVGCGSDADTTTTTTTTSGETTTAATTGDTTAASDASSESTSGALQVGTTPDYPEGRRDASTPRTKANENPLVLGSLTMDGKFSPFFSTSAHDRVILDYTQIKLLTNNELAEPVAGVNEASLAYDFSMTVADDNSTSTYEIVLKNGIQFSDGQVINADDVLFNLYTFLDPAYEGTTTLYSMDIQGLQAYRSQIPDEAQMTAKQEEFQKTADAAAEEVESKGKEAAYYDKGWELVAAAVKGDGTTLKTNFDQGYTWKDFGLEGLPKLPKEATAMQVAMVYIKAADYKDSFAYKEGTGLEAGKEYTEEELLAGAVAFLQAEGYTLKTYDEEFGFTTYDELVALVVKEEQAKFLEENKGSVKNISGITKGIKTCDDGVVRETVTIVLNGVDPKAIWNFTIDIAPMHHYAGQERHDKANGVDYFGVDFSDPAFMASMKEKTGIPVGAGPYVATDANGGDVTDKDSFFSNGIVYLKANDNFMLGAPKIKYLRIKTINSGSEKDAVQTGEVHWSEPQAGSEIINQISSDPKYAHMGYVLVDNLGYGYVGLNASMIKERKVRQALMHAMNTELSLNSYPGGLAEVIHRPMSKVSWAYPTGATAYYPFDETGETSKKLFEEAGYKYENGKMMAPDGKQANFTLFLPSEAKDHPAGAIFLGAQEVLAKIGVNITIDVDSDLLNKLDTGTVPSWAAAWQATIDPDMFQTYYSDPSKTTSTSPKQNGMFYMFENGTDEEKALLAELNEKVMEGRQSLNVDERKPVYSRALDIVMELAVELPTYQRKNMYAYNKEVIDASSLFQNVTPYKMPIADIWNVSLLGE